MKMLKKVVIDCGDKKLNLYKSKYKNSEFVGNARECILFAWGFGTDQAAELRYEMAKFNKNKKTADVSKQKG